MLEDHAVLDEGGRDLAVAAAGDGHQLPVAQQLADPVGRGAQELGDLRGGERVHRVRAYGAPRTRGQPGAGPATAARGRRGDTRRTPGASRRSWTSTALEERARELLPGRRLRLLRRRRGDRDDAARGPRRPGGPGGCAPGSSRGDHRRRRWAPSCWAAPVRTPIGVAPWAYQGMAHPDGELATARGAAAAGSLMTVSTSATHALEEVGGRGRRLPDVVPALPAALRRAHRRPRAAGRARPATRALVLTVDLPLLGRRRRDLRHDFALPAGLRHGQPPGRRRPALAAGPGDGDLDLRRHRPLRRRSPGCRSSSRACSAATTPPAACRPAPRRSGCPRTAAGRSTRRSPARTPCPRWSTPWATTWRSTPTAASGPAPTSSPPWPWARRAVFVGRPTIWGLATGGADGVARRPHRPGRGAGAHHGAVRPRRRPVGAPRHRRPRAIASTRAVTGAKRWAPTGERPAPSLPCAWATFLTTPARRPP